MDWSHMSPGQRMTEWYDLTVEEQAAEVMQLLQDGDHPNARALLDAFHTRGDRQASKRALLLDLFDRQDRTLFQALVDLWIPSPDPLVQAAGLLNTHLQRAPRSSRLFLMTAIDQLMLRRT